MCPAPFQAAVYGAQAHAQAQSETLRTHSKFERDLAYPTKERTTKLDTAHQAGTFRIKKIGGAVKTSGPGYNLQLAWTRPWWLWSGHVLDWPSHSQRINFKQPSIVWIINKSTSSSSGQGIADCRKIIFAFRAATETLWADVDENDFKLFYCNCKMVLPLPDWLAEFGSQLTAHGLRLSAMPHGYINFLRFFCFIATPLKLNWLFVVVACRFCCCWKYNNGYYVETIVVRLLLN